MKKNVEKRIRNRNSKWKEERVRENRSVRFEMRAYQLPVPASSSRKGAVGIQMKRWGRQVQEEIEGRGNKKPVARL